MEKEDFGERLKRLRKAAGLTQAALAERAGVSLNSVSRWEIGDRQPSWESVVALSKALGVETSAFDRPASGNKAGK